MDKAIEILEQLEVTGSTNAKLALMKSDDTGALKRVFNLTYDYQRLFFIKKFDEVKGEGEFNPAWLDELEERAKMLEQIGRTQAAKDAFAQWLAYQSPLVAKWARRIILRDLRCGATTELANKAGFEVPVFEVQLAKDGEKCKKLDKMIKEGLFLTPKFDGYRCLAILIAGQCRLYSRNGMEFENFPMIAKAIEDKCAEAGIEDLVFDGEIMSDDFNSMQQSAFASKRGTVVGDMVYNIFDMLPAQEWIDQKFKLPYKLRRANLENFFVEYGETEHLRVVLGKELDRNATLADIKAVERVYTEQGFEGVMANPIDLPYFQGKVSNTMLKFKTMLSMDCEVVDWFPGKPGTKYEKTLGGLVVIQENGVRCEVGSGFSDKERDEIFARLDDIIGQGRKMEVKYQELTEDGVMRFPIKRRWRNDK